MQKALTKFLSEENCMANEPHKIYMRFQSANCLTSKNHGLVINSAGMGEMVAFGKIFEQKIS